MEKVYPNGRREAVNAPTFFDFDKEAFALVEFQKQRNKQAREQHAKRALERFTAVSHLQLI